LFFTVQIYTLFSKGLYFFAATFSARYLAAKAIFTAQPYQLAIRPLSAPYEVAWGRPFLNKVLSAKPVS
jgi:hypothetical protein